MQNDLISRDTLKAKMIKYGFHAPNMTVAEFVEDELLAVNAVPVMRCKECEHLSCIYTEYGKYWCEYYTPENLVQLEHFRSYGERKDNQ